MNQKNRVLIGLLVIQLVIIGYMYRPVQHQTAASEPFFQGLTTSEISGIILTDADNKSIALQRQQEVWHIEDGLFPADSKKIEKILNKIIGLTSGRVVTRTKSSQVRLQVADQLFNRKIELRLADASPKIFYLGSSPSQKSIYFREAGTELVYLVRGISSWELQVDNESWWQTVYVDYNDDDLTAIELNNTHGTLSFQKEDDKNWQLTNVKPESTKGVAEFIKSLRRISISGYMSKERPADLGDAIGKLVYTGRKVSESLEIWPNPSEDDEYIIKDSKHFFYAKVRAYEVEKILQATQKDFITGTK